MAIEWISNKKYSQEEYKQLIKQKFDPKLEEISVRITNDKDTRGYVPQKVYIYEDGTAHPKTNYKQAVGQQYTMLDAFESGDYIFELSKSISDNNKLIQVFKLENGKKKIKTVETTDANGIKTPRLKDGKTIEKSFPAFKFRPPETKTDWDVLSKKVIEHFYK